MVYKWAMAIQLSFDNCIDPKDHTSEQEIKAIALCLWIMPSYHFLYGNVCKGQQINLRCTLPTLKKLTMQVASRFTELKLKFSFIGLKFTKKEDILFSQFSFFCFFTI